MTQRYRKLVEVRRLVGRQVGADPGPIPQVVSGGGPLSLVRRCLPIGEGVPSLLSWRRRPQAAGRPGFGAAKLKILARSCDQSSTTRISGHHHLPAHYLFSQAPLLIPHRLSEVSNPQTQANIHTLHFLTTTSQPTTPIERMQSGKQVIKAGDIGTRGGLAFFYLTNTWPSQTTARRTSLPEIQDPGDSSPQS